MDTLMLLDFQLSLELIQKQLNVYDEKKSAMTPQINNFHTVIPFYAREIFIYNN